MDTVKVLKCTYEPEHYRMTLILSGHASEVIEACREIAQSVLRGKWRWWFQNVLGQLDDHDAMHVSDMIWTVDIRWGD